MNSDRTPTFCDTGLAERVEHAEAELIAEASRAAHRRQPGQGFVMPVAGVATFAEPGSPFNKVAGLGFAGGPSASDLDEIERAFAAGGTDVQVELSHLGDPCIGALQTDPSYRLTSFENALGRALDGQVEPETPPGARRPDRRLPAGGPLDRGARRIRRDPCRPSRSLGQSNRGAARFVAADMGDLASRRQARARGRRRRRARQQRWYVGLVADQRNKTSPRLNQCSTSTSVGHSSSPLRWRPGWRPTAAAASSTSQPWPPTGRSARPPADAVTLRCTGSASPTWRPT